LGQDFVGEKVRMISGLFPPETTRNGSIIVVATVPEKVAIDMVLCFDIYRCHAEVSNIEIFPRRNALQCLLRYSMSEVLMKFEHHMHDYRSLAKYRTSKFSHHRSGAASDKLPILGLNLHHTKMSRM
jgi:hypothetical protein